MIREFSRMRENTQQLLVTITRAPNVEGHKGGRCEQPRKNRSIYNANFMAISSCFHEDNRNYIFGISHVVCVAIGPTEYLLMVLPIHKRE